MTAARCPSYDDRTLGNGDKVPRIGQTGHVPPVVVLHVQVCG